MIDWAAISARPIIIILDPCQVDQYYIVTQWHDTIIIINKIIIIIDVSAVTICITIRQCSAGQQFTFFSSYFHNQAGFLLLKQFAQLVQLIHPTHLISTHTTVTRFRMEQPFSLNTPQYPHPYTAF